VPQEGKRVGYVTSGTVVPYWKFEGHGLAGRITDQHGMRPIALGMVESTFRDGDRLEVELRGKRLAAVVGANLRGEVAPYARPVLYDASGKAETSR
jgi:aminomethyltransferase